MADFNIPNIVLIDRLNKTVLVLHNNSSLDHNNVHPAEAENTEEYENLALKI